jgi:hypothetical protein
MTVFLFYLFYQMPIHIDHADRERDLLRFETVHYLEVFLSSVLEDIPELSSLVLVKHQETVWMDDDGLPCDIVTTNCQRHTSAKEALSH